MKLHAINAIGLLGDKAASQLQKLIDALDTKDPLILDAAVKAIGAMGDAGKPAVPALKDVLSKQTEPYFKQLIEAAMKYIEESKPSDVKATDPKQPDPKAPPKK